MYKRIFYTSLIKLDDKGFTKIDNAHTQGKFDDQNVDNNLQKSGILVKNVYTATQKSVHLKTP
jgi:hypothetical protein